MGERGAGEYGFVVRGRCCAFIGYDDERHDDSDKFVMGAIP